MGPRVKQIIHLDMDAFYASVEMLDKPAFRGQPVIVGGPQKRGVVSAASYEARKFGIHSALPIAVAMRLCPQGIFLPVRMSRYKEISDQIFEIFLRFTPLVEPLSIDEAFLDVTASIRLFGPAEEIAKQIKNQVRDEIGLTVSAGVAPSKLVAKIASDLNKPDGLTIVPEGKVQDFLDPLPIEKLWGVGKITQKDLSLLNVKTIGDLSCLPKDLLRRRFGQQGLQLYFLSKGIDDREVQPERIIKSIGREETFPEDILVKEKAEKEILILSQRVARRLRRHGKAGRTITLKVTYDNFTRITRSLTLPAATDDGRTIYRVALELLEKTEIGNRPIRLLGIYLSQLTRPGEGQLSLFDQTNGIKKTDRLNRALDAIHDKYGDQAIRSGRIMEE
ncbi:MAG: DNA polymerase IV [Deltaproteobacteria bacterium]|nr:DNA polymerase IV [Deltaproteobacteria bacterium]